MKRLAILFAFAVWLIASESALAAFGLTTTTAAYTIDTGSTPNLVFKIRRTEGGSTTSIGDIMSMVYNGLEYQDQSRGSQLNSGFDYLYTGVSAVSLTAATVGTDYIKVTVVAGGLTHYYIARKGYPHVYMATYFTSEPSTLGLCRYILRIPATRLPNGPAPSDIRNNTGAIESADIFGMADGTTRSKHYSNMRLKDWSYIGATGTNVGVWMLRSNHEGDSGGPFYRSLLNQCGDDQEITYIINYGEGQTEAFRTNILNGPYTVVFNSGAPPTPATVDTSWISGMGLTGFVGATGRGTVTGAGITGRDGSQAYTIGFSNTAAQYWTDAAAGSGAFTMSGMLPGTYTMKVFKNEYVVYTASVTVNAGATTALPAFAITADPSRTVPLWRIGSWDGSPGELLNGAKVTTMHPSDTRMSSWTPGDYTVGTSTPATGMPCYQWKDVNASQAIKFELTAAQLVASTVRVGITTAFSGARPKISVNAWTFPTNPAASEQPDTRTLTVGTYRGNNTTYTFAVPASALVVGTNTLWVFPISGSGATGFLSAGYSFDCIDFSQGSQTLELPGPPGNLTAAGDAAAVNLNWTAASGAAGYIIRRATTAGGPYTTIASGITATTYTDAGLAAGATYYYVVSGANSTGAGLATVEASVNTGVLKAFYAFTGDATDSSGNGYHGTANAVTYVSDGGTGQTAQFNGTSSYVAIPSSVQDDFSVCLWVKTTDLGSTASQWYSGKGLVDGEMTGSLADWGMSVLNGKLAFGVGKTDITFSSTSVINDGVWHHVAATRNNTTGAVQLYVDGAAQTTGTGPTGSRTAPTGLRIGSIGTGAPTGFLAGSIDGVRLYGKILNAAEVAALFNAGLQVPPPPAPFTATAAGSSQVTLQWTAAPTASSYSVRRATVSGGTYTTIATGVTATIYNDINVTRGTTYYYLVTALNANGESADSVQASATPVVPAPVAHLRFDESSGTTAADATGNSWNGTFLNGPTWATSGNGKVNNAVSLDGTNDHVTLPAGVVSALGDFTISAWVKWNGGSDWQRVFDFGTNTNNYMFFTPKSAAGVARFGIRAGAVAEQQIDAAAALPATGVWTHVAVALSGSTGTLYLNGAPAGTNPAMTLKPSSLGITALNYLGRSQFPDPYFSGALDEFRIHNRALSAADIGALAAPPQPPSGLTPAAEDGQVTLTWTAVTGATAYSIKRGATNAGPFTPLAAGFTVPGYTDEAVTNGTTYYYVVSTAVGGVESADSTPAAATPLTDIQAWRQANFGSFANTGNSADSADPDGDGWTNAQEFNSGTNPNDRNSSLKVSSVAASGNDMVITFPTVSGKLYRAEYSTALQAWATVLTNGVPQENLAGTGSVVQVTDTNGATHPRRFYRVVGQ